MKRLTLMLLVWIAAARSQDRPSIHQIQSESFRDHPAALGSISFPKSVRRADLTSAKVTNAVVYGFHPYWMNGSESNYYFSLLTHLAYFSGEVDPTTGGFSNTRSWSTATVVSLAQQHGLKVHFTATLFSNHAALLGSSTNRSNLISNILSQIALRGADGCNIDFEGVGAGNAENFRTFIYDLGTALKSAGKELVVELPAVDWGTDEYTASFFSTNNAVVDYYFLMAYDYWWKGSTMAGPVAPVTTGTSIQHVTRSFNAYLALGCPAAKLIGGFPYYGYEWPVSSSSRMASVVTSRGSGDAQFYYELKSLLPTLSAGNKFMDATYNVPWYRYDSSGTGTWRQGWYDDSLSLAMKYDSVKAYGLAGTGMWALGYDGTHTELWGALKNAFASTPDPAHTSLDAFETGVGRFDKAPSWSGSTSGISTSSSASWSNDRANHGLGSLQVTLVDRPDTVAPWKVRLLSGSGTVANNVTLTDGGYIGFWMRTTSAPSGAQVGVLVDDGAGGTEKSPMQNVINSDSWQLFQFNTNGPGWSSFASGNGSVDGPTFTLDAIYLTAPDGSADWTFTIDDVSYNVAGELPVQMVSLAATMTADGVRLEWSTASETDNYGFDVERREIGTALALSESPWSTVGFVAGSGTSTSPRSYALLDADPPRGRVAYRLRQIDRTGSYAYSAEVEVETGERPFEPLVLRSYPNPFNPATAVEFWSRDGGPATVRVFDLLGREVATLFAGDLGRGELVRAMFDASGLTSGTYLVRLRTERHQRVVKILLAR